jgi:serine/threonine protein kinase
MIACSSCKKSESVNKAKCGLSFCSLVCEQKIHSECSIGVCYSIPEKKHKHFWRDWLIDPNPLGTGASGIVLKITSKTDPKQMFAIKLVGDIDINNTPKFQDHLDAVCQIRESCPDIVTYTAIYYVRIPEIAKERFPNQKHTYALTMPLIPAGDLYRHVDSIIDANMFRIRVEQENNPETLAVMERETKREKKERAYKRLVLSVQTYAATHQSGANARWLVNAFRQLAVQLKCIHDAGVEHRDIKPSNILYSVMDHKFHIIDFDLSKKVGTKLVRSGTLNYMAPEIHLKFTVPEDCRPSDIWSLGAVFYYLATATEVISTEDLPENPGVRSMQAIMHALYELRRDPPKGNKDIRDIILGCLRDKIEERWTLTDVIERCNVALATIDTEMGQPDIGRRGGGGGGGFGGGGFGGGRRSGGGSRSFRTSGGRSFAPRRAFRTTSTRPYYSRTRLGGGTRWWRNFAYPFWYPLLLPPWYLYALRYYGYPVYPITVDIDDEIALRQELEMLRAENAALLRSGRYALVPDLQRRQYVWIQRP